MQTRYTAEKPNEITFALKIEATAAEFLELRDELRRYGQRALPAPLTAQLSDALTRILAASRKVISPEDAPTLVGSFMGHNISADPAMPEETVELLRKRCHGGL